MPAGYDVIVAGAGPAGSIAALRLSRAGARVLLLEKQQLGRDKPCGGGLTPRAWHNLEVPLNGMVDARVQQVDVVRRRATPLTLDLRDRPVLMVRRVTFDERLARAAVAAGAELREREPAEAASARNGGVVVRTARDEHRAAVLLIATGAEGELPAALGLHRRSTRIAVGVEIEGEARAPRLHPERILLDFHMPGGYAWAFPKGDAWNAGVLTARRESGPQLRRLLAAFVARHQIVFAGTPRVRGHRLPMRTRSMTLARGRVAVLGDAAALADPFFGEGIAQALVSGRHAADAALAVLLGKAADLSSYQLALDSSLARHGRRMRIAAGGVYRAPDAATHLLTLAPARAVARRWATEPFAMESVPWHAPISMATC